MSEARNPRIYDQSTNLPEGPVSRYIERVANSLDTLSFSEQDRQRVLVDHIVGSALRALGTEAGYNDVLQPLAHNTYRTDLIDQDTGQLAPDWLMTITRKGGARRVIAAIHHNPTGIGALQGVHSRFLIESNEQGEPDPSTITMVSVDQIAAYLDTDTPEESNLEPTEAAIAWRQTILTEITEYLNNSTRKEAWKTVDNIGSDLSSVRQSQEAWQRAVSIAGKAGLDVDLLTRSAEEIRHIKEQGIQNVGSVALLSVEQDFNRLLAHEA